MKLLHKLPTPLQQFIYELRLTHVIIAVNICYFALSLVLSLVYPLPSVLNILGAMQDRLVLQGELWRVLTAGFLHANFLHILANMYSLWILGTIVERYYGGKRTWTIYIWSIVLANIFSLVFGLVQALAFRATTSLLIPSVGASSAIFGLMGLLLGNTTIRRRGASVLPIDRNQLLFLVGINMLISFAIPGIDILAHVGGLLAGVALSLLVDPLLHFKNNVWREKIEVVLFWSSILLTLLALLGQMYSFIRFIIL